MTIPAYDSTTSSDAYGIRSSGIISGMRPARRGARPIRAGGTDVASVWAPFAAVCWLLAMTPAAVIAVKAGFAVSVVIAIVQAGLIVVALMRPAWAPKMHLLILGVGVLFSTMLLAMISFDRSEYRPDLERFDSTVRGSVTDIGD